MSLCCEVLGWDSLDIEKLENIMEEFKLSIREVIKETACKFGEDSTDITGYMYGALSIGSKKIKQKLLNVYPEYKYIIDDFEENIYVNYIASGFDSAFGNYNYRNLVGDEKDEYLFNLMNKVLEESGKNKMEKGE